MNLTDGLDGLAVGLVIFVILTYAGICYLSGHVNIAGYLRIPYIPGSGELTVYCMCVLGASIGFLWFNCYPASIFMGDVGSLSLGGGIGIIAVLIKKEIVLFLAGGLFVIEAFSVILQILCFRLRGKRILLMAPIHHHFQMKGWVEPKVIVRFWIIAGLLSVLTLLTLKIR